MGSRKGTKSFPSASCISGAPEEMAAGGKGKSRKTCGHQHFPQMVKCNPIYYAVMYQEAFLPALNRASYCRSLLFLLLKQNKLFIKYKIELLYFYSLEI